MRQSDTDLLERCQRGDAAAQQALWLAYKDRVYSICLHFFRGDRALAEDVTQDVFVKLFTRLNRFEGRAEFSTWLYRLVANACLDEQRRRSRWRFFGELSDSLPTMWPTERPAADEQLTRDELSEAVRTAVGALSPKLRIAILMRYFDDLSYEQMAQALECSMGTVASRLSRAHAELARRLAGHRDALQGGGR